MPSPFRIMEILACSLAGFLPYVMLMTYPFRHRLRAAGLLTALATVLQLICDLSIGLGLVEDPGTATLLVIGIHLLLALILVRSHLGEKLFCLLTTVNSAIALSLAAKFLEGVFFPEQALVFGWTYLVLLISLQALILLPFGMYLTTRHIRVTDDHAALWRFLWLIPAFVFAVWVYISRNALLSLPVDLIMIGLTVLSCVITLTFIRKPQKSAEEEPSAEEPVAESLPEQESPAAPVAPVSEESVSDPIEAAPPTTAEASIREERKPEKRNQNMDFTKQMLSQHHGHLTARIEQSSQFHRELRRHIDAMAYRLEKKQYDKLQTHLTSLRNQFDYEDQIRYCENNAINTILAYFSQMSGYFGIKVTADVQLPGETAAAEADLSVLFGDLLDNSLDACKKQTGSDRQISVSARTDENTMYLSVENTYDAPLRQDSEGGYLSSKHDGYGMGLEVCHAIAARYNGKLEIRDDNGQFRVNITLNF